jgi:hypothetical protein
MVLGVHRGTAWRWSRLPDVRRAVAEVEDDIRAQARRRARMAAVEAVDVLRSLVADADVPPAVRVSAARGLATVFAQLEPKQLDVAATTIEQPTYDGPPRETLDQMLDRIAENMRLTEAVDRRLAVAGNGDGQGAQP